MTHLPTHSDPIEPDRARLLAQVVALQGRLATLPEIEQAKGALMVTYGLSADAAFDLLRFHSQSGNVKIRALAAHLTGMMSALHTSGEAIVQFDRLMSDALGRAHRAERPPAAVHRPDAQNIVGEPPVTTTVTAGELPQLTVRAVSTAPPGITIAAHSPDEPLVYANDAFTELTGYPPDEIVGRNCRFLQGADTDPRRTSIIRDAVTLGRDVSVVLANYRSDGSRFWNEVSISPIRDRDHRITHYLGTQTDVTSRYQAKAALGQ